MLTEFDLQMYITALEEPPTPDVDAVDDMSYAAAVAFTRMVDNCATVEDLAAYRTWMTYCRMRGDHEHTLIGAIAVSEDYARRLGVE